MSPSPRAAVRGGLRPSCDSALNHQPEVSDLTSHRCSPWTFLSGPTTSVAGVVSFTHGIGTEWLCSEWAPKKEMGGGFLGREGGGCQSGAPRVGQAVGLPHLPHLIPALQEGALRSQLSPGEVLGPLIL